MERTKLRKLTQPCLRMWQGYRSLYKGAWWKKIATGFATFAVGVLLLLGAIDINLFYLFGRSPGFADIKDPVVSEASEVYSADSVLMGKYFNENRTPVKYEQISPILIRTLIATEDERFYQHHGVDFAGIIAATKDMLRGNARGASTITQQLAKNLFRVRTNYDTGLLGHIPGIKLVIMKLKEWIVAEKLESVYTKEEILTMYLNTVDFGSNSFGIRTACHTYFNTTPDALTYEQAATLVGLLKATSTYNPKLNPKNATARRAVVLENLFRHNGIIISNKVATQTQLDSIKALPLIVESQKEESSYDGIAPYFRQALKPYIDRLCKMGLVKGYDADNKLDLYADGLKIYTTIDTRMQQYAEDAVDKHMRVVQNKFDNHWGATNPWVDRQYREIPDFIEDIARKTSAYKYYAKVYDDNEDSIFAKLSVPHHTKVFTYNGMEDKEISTMDSIRYMVRFMHCGFVAMEPDTRQVKAWVGDIDFDSWKYDKVTAMRQPGSTFKLFVYTEAMNQGMTPVDRREDSYVAYPDTDATGKPGIWAPHNANGYFSGGNMPLRSAFAQSINSVAVKVGMEVGIHNVAKTAHAMGIESDLHETKSLSLGSSDVNLMELVNSYCTVIDDGLYNMPIMISKIIDRKGKIIYEAKLNAQQVIPYRSAYFMQQMLRAGLTERGGTSAALWQYIHPILQYTEFGGKTGTSNNHSDAWFVGVTPKLVAGCWVGGEYRSIHFRTGELGQGSRTALPVFGYFIQSVLLDDRFPRYREKFAEAKENIKRDEWMCEGYYAQHPDSMLLDSLRTVVADSLAQLEENVPTE